MSVQSTFTKQKRELAKATLMISKIRSQESRLHTLSIDDKIINVTRDSYVDIPPEEIVEKVLGIVTNVVSSHGARQKANSKNKGLFSWNGINLEMTVPQLRAMMEAQVILSELVNRLPRKNPKLVPNGVMDGRPAFEHRVKCHYVTEKKRIPYEEANTTLIRTYVEEEEVLTHKTQKIDIDYGMDIRIIEEMQEMATDFGTAIQIAIDEANAKGQEADSKMDSLIKKITGTFLDKLKK